MHMQRSEPGWIEAVLRLPDYAVVKAFDAGLLADAKQKWTAAGRDPAKLFTVFRHFGLTTPPRHYTFAQMMDYWEAAIRQFVDATYLREFAPYVDVVSEANEYVTENAWNDDPDIAGVRRSIEAVSACWNERFRGRELTTADGGHGFIPANCRMALLAGTVSHSPPKFVFERCKADDNILDYHGYSLVVNGERAPDCWPNHSGRAHRLEQEYGVKCLHLAGECGPYTSRDGGWRHPDCLGGDEDKLLAVMGATWADLIRTPAYLEGRLIGQGAWFTSGHVGWEFYQLETRQLTRLADALRGVWHPGEYDMDQQTKDAIAEHARAILELVGQPVEPPAPPPPAWLFQVRILVNALNVRSGPAVTFADIGDVLKDAVVSVYEVAPNGWYRIHVTDQEWISGSPTYSVRL